MKKRSKQAEAQENCKPDEASPKKNRMKVQARAYGRGREKEGGGKHPYFLPRGALLGRKQSPRAERIGQLLRK